MSGKELVAGLRPKERARVSDIEVVVLEVPPNVTMTENVVGLDEEGGVVWRVERIRSTGSNSRDHYVGITRSTGSTVTLANWNGMLVDVDVRTGKVVGETFGK